MPMEMLRALAALPMPVDLDDPGDIDKVQVLCAAELITAWAPQPQQLPSGFLLYQAARVLAITDKGRRALGLGLAPPPPSQRH